MNFDAIQLTDLQACPRKFLLNLSWRPWRWRPKALFDACLRKAILDFSNQVPMAKVRADARASFLQAAANPGLDIQGRPYEVAREWATLLEVLVVSLPQMRIPQYLREGSTITLNPVVQWRIAAFADSHCDLHRFITVDHWDAATQEREVRSWNIAGDIAVADQRLYLHIIEIGQIRDGRRASLWVRGWQHPTMPNLKVHFRRKDGSTFKGWKAVRLVEHPNLGLEEWTQRIWAEGAGVELSHILEIEKPSENQRQDTLKHILVESLRSRSLPIEYGDRGWTDLPLNRGACDLPSPCPFRAACYEGASLEKSGLYARRRQLSEAERSTPAASACVPVPALTNSA